MIRIPLYTADRMTAIDHALVEAEQCARMKCHCAAIAMLRKALDLWSVGFSELLEMKFGKGEKDDLHWRLEKISSANPVYAQTIGEVISGLKLDANNALHDPTVCFRVDDFFQIDLDPRPVHEEYEKVAALVTHLVAVTNPTWRRPYVEMARRRRVF
jgi:hypothetical protein